MPGIRLIDEEEEYEFKWGDSSIFYRRVPSSVMRRIEQKHTNRRGILNERGMADDVFAYAIRRWTKVDDGKGGLAEFEAALVAKLPEEVRGDLAELLYAGNPDGGSEGNLKSGSLPEPQ